MHKKLLEIPERIEAERVYLRCYRAGDGQWFHAMSIKNRKHLKQYEADNVVMSIENELGAESLVRELAADWQARNCFFMGVFDKKTNEFVAQVYIGPVNWNVPEFEIGFFADVDHEGQGYVSEAVNAAVKFVFKHLKAHRIRMECDDTNQRSLRVAERCNFSKEGHIRENKMNPDGTLSGTVHFGLLKSEYNDSCSN